MLWKTESERPYFASSGSPRGLLCLFELAKALASFLYRDLPSFGKAEPASLAAEEFYSQFSLELLNVLR